MARRGEPQAAGAFRMRAILELMVPRGGLSVEVDNFSNISILSGFPFRPVYHRNVPTSTASCQAMGPPPTLRNEFSNALFRSKTYAASDISIHLPNGPRTRGPLTPRPARPR